MVISGSQEDDDALSFANLAEDLPGTSGGANRKKRQQKRKIEITLNDTPQKQLRKKYKFNDPKPRRSNNNNKKVINTESTGHYANNISLTYNIKQVKEDEFATIDDTTDNFDVVTSNKVTTTKVNKNSKTTSKTRKKRTKNTTTKSTKKTTKKATGKTTKKVTAKVTTRVTPKKPSTTTEPAKSKNECICAVDQLDTTMFTQLNIVKSMFSRKYIQDNFVPNHCNNRNVSWVLDVEEGDPPGTTKITNKTVIMSCINAINCNNECQRAYCYDCYTNLQGDQNGKGPTIRTISGRRARG